MTQATLSKIIAPKLIVGLGNPETKYEKTRHNIGFEIVDALAEAWQFSWANNRRFQGLSAEGIAPNGQKICLLKPQTYMNNSGQAVRAAVDWYKLSPDSVLIVYDDMDLPLGKLRLRLSGSAGGHNGMKSIIAHLSSQDFPRLRIGIGKSDRQDSTISHVLGKFSSSETEIVRETIAVAILALEFSLQEGVEKAMSLYNNRTVTNQA
jgi:PTH1 family peptidyl-tRNA hydrolase